MSKTMMSNSISNRPASTNSLGQLDLSDYVAQFQHDYYYFFEKEEHDYVACVEIIYWNFRRTSF